MSASWRHHYTPRIGERVKLLGDGMLPIDRPGRPPVIRHPITGDEAPFVVRVATPDRPPWRNVLASCAV